MGDPDTGPPAPRRRWRLVEVAPEPDVPHPRDRRGAQRGMALILVAGALLWLAVAALVLFLLR